MTEDLEAENEQQHEHEPHTVRLPTAFSPTRMEAFSDGVLAVIITIMVLNIRPPNGVDFDALRGRIPELLVYVLSFAYIGIYWNNHHHLLRATPHIDGAVMWANLHLLFWLSLIPIATNWSGEKHEASWPAATYGGIALMAGIAYYILSRLILRANKGADIERAIGTDFKGIISLVIYALGMLVAVFVPVLSYFVYATVSVMWFIPDRRLVRRQIVTQPEPGADVPARERATDPSPTRRGEPEGRG